MTVKLTVANRVATVEVVPSASSLIISALKEPPRDRKKVKNIKHNGNLTLQQVSLCATDAGSCRLTTLVEPPSVFASSVLFACR